MTVLSAPPMAEAAAPIDVRALMKSLTQQELLAAAEAYFASIADPTFHLSKPFANVDDCPTLLANFSKLLRDGHFLRGHRVLEFGAGSCWGGRLLNQLGMAVTSLDISPSALALGERLKRDRPVYGRQPEHAFLLYDGVKIGLPDRSMDRVFCFDAFHHVVNPEQTLRELARVLDDGGVAAFCEPGPLHSHTAESQREMRQYAVIENDVVIEDIWAAAQAAGFSDIYFSLQSESTVRLGYREFLAFRKRGFDDAMATSLKAHIVQRNRDSTLFYLVKGAVGQADSRSRDGLVGELRVDRVERLPAASVGERLRIGLEVRNVSAATWLRSGGGHGCVNIGVQVVGAEGVPLDPDYARHRFLKKELPPGEAVKTTFEVPVPHGADGCALQIDLVSESVCWFAQNGSRTERIQL
jgi:SAM-dependent methyltransferase